jgi:hypothetical protein
VINRKFDLDRNYRNTAEILRAARAFSVPPGSGMQGVLDSTRLVRAAAAAILPSVVTPIETLPPPLSTNQPASKSPARS